MAAHAEPGYGSAAGLTADEPLSVRSENGLAGKYAMASFISTIEVEDYEKWRAMFDSMSELRRKHGVSGEHVYPDVTNPNSLTVVIDGDLSGLQAYAQSQSLRDAMAQAGVVGPPRITPVNDVT